MRHTTHQKDNTFCWWLVIPTMHAVITSAGQFLSAGTDYNTRKAALAYAKERNCDLYKVCESTEIQPHGFKTFELINEAARQILCLRIGNTINKKTDQKTERAIKKQLREALGVKHTTRTRAHFR